MKRIIILCGMLLVQYSLTEAVSFKKYAGEYMHIGIGGRSLAMGGAAVATVNDVTSAYWNPAGLTQAKGFQIEFMHTKQFISSIQQNYLGLSNEYDENSTIAFSLIYLTVKDIQDSEIPDVPTFVISAQDPADQPLRSRFFLTTMDEGLSLGKLVRCALAVSRLLQQPEGALDPVP